MREAAFDNIFFGIESAEPGPLLLKGKLEALLMYSLMAHHLIVFAREVCAGRLNASYYSVKLREPAQVLQAAE